MVKDHDLEGRAVLITGAAGCIGAWTVKMLSDMGARPVVYDLSENRARLDLIMDAAADISWERGDIADYNRLNQVVQKHDIFAIIHLAALQVPFCKADPVGSARVNVVGTAAIFEVARQNNIGRICYASSIASPAMGENDWLDTLYGAHKVCGEQMAKVYWQDWQVPSVCVRPGVIYGPGRDQGMSAAPTIAILAAFKGQSYNIPFSGPVAFVHVEDAAARFVGAIAQDQKGAHIFDMNGTPAEVSDILSLITDKIQGANVSMSGGALPFPHAEDDGSLDKHVNASPYRSMATGIDQTLQIFKQAENRDILTDALATQLIENNS